MNDYRLVQIEELDKRIEETRSLLEDPSMVELAQQELTSLEEQKKVIEGSLQNSQQKNEMDFDERNILLEVKGAAGGDEAKLWAEELFRMYTRAAQKKGFQLEPVDEAVVKINGRGAFREFK